MLGLCNYWSKQVGTFLTDWSRGALHHLSHVVALYLLLLFFCRCCQFIVYTFFSAWLWITFVSPFIPLLSSPLSSYSFVTFPSKIPCSFLSPLLSFFQLPLLHWGLSHILLLTCRARLSLAWHTLISSPPLSVILSVISFSFGLSLSVLPFPHSSLL